MVNGQYEDTVYQSDRILESTVIPDLTLTPAQVLAFGKEM